MIRDDFSQLPVIDNGIVKGSITDRLLMVRYAESDRQTTKIRDIMERRFPVIDSDTKLETVRYLLTNTMQRLSIRETGSMDGIITKHDVLKAMK
jgi:predicted transcriptional regulator